ncbi:hypothetical protein LCGC14_0568140 [marine sediment metagenome]|uniref:Uncharacterized protein n=1 Tax=marine sediment metagenome TaxID=412755 RepID=A0A0F9S3M5_9ZZZZ|nr:hypothetical protein [bacterium]
MAEEKAQLGGADPIERNALSLNHRHGGGGTDGNKIRARNIEKLYQHRYIPASEFDVTDANVSLAQVLELGAVVFADGASAVSTFNIWIPTWRTSLIGLKLIYIDRSASSLNIRLAFATRRARIGVATITDTLAEASYATVGTADAIQTIEIPRIAWNNLLNTQYHDIIGFEITRNGAAGTDTYNNDLEIIGVLPEFA